MKIRKIIKSDTTAFLQLFVAIFFIASAIVILGNHGSGDKIISSFNQLLGRNSTLTIVIAVVELLLGAILFLDLFVVLPKKYLFVAVLAILALWGLSIAMSYIVDNRLLQPNLFVWTREIALQLVILISFLGIIRK